MVQYLDLTSDTICSPITAPGYSGISVIRVSGQKALEFTKKLFSPLPKKIKSHCSYLGFIENEKQERVDQVLLTFFTQGKSFTGDETVEISCHGNPLIVNQIVDLYLHQGCRVAQKGEFSFRAFYNGKIDLVQAEAIGDLVTAKNNISSEASLKHLSGDISQVFTKLEADLVLAISHLEATIDFVEQDIDPDDYKAVSWQLEAVKERLKQLISSYDVGKNLRQGFKVLLFGESNVGKSSLFNAIFKQEKAIVTDMAGTTRDLISGQTFLGNNEVEFIDSAGVRSTDDKIENVGIQKTLEASQTADVILYVLDCSQDQDLEKLLDFEIDKTIFVLNKVDLLQSQPDIKNLSEKIKKQNPNLLFYMVSAKSGSGLEDLKSGIEKFLVSQKSFDGSEVITQARHFNHLRSIENSVEKAIELLNIKESPDLISQELSFALMEINGLLGKEYNDEILDKIFSDFCIGK